MKGLHMMRTMKWLASGVVDSKCQPRCHEKAQSSLSLLQLGHTGRAKHRHSQVQL